MGAKNTKPQTTNSKPLNSSHANKSPLPAKLQEQKRVASLTLLDSKDDHFEIKSLPPGVNRIIADYWNYDCFELGEIKHDYSVRINKNLSFFNKKTNLFATLAAQFILSARINEVIAIVTMHPEVLEPVIEARDPCGRRVRGKLLQIAAATGSFNMVKQLTDHLPLAKKEEIIRLQLEEQFSHDWKKTTDERMNQYLDAVKTLGEGIIAMQVPKDSTLKSECKAIIQDFYEAIKPKPDQVITKGLIYHPSILYQFREFFMQRLRDFGGFHSDKTDLFQVVGLGSLIRQLSAPDALYVIKGKNYMYLGEIPAVSLQFTDGSFFYSSELGFSFYLDETGSKCTGYERDRGDRFLGGKESRWQAFYIHLDLEISGNIKLMMDLYDNKEMSRNKTFSA